MLPPEGDFGIVKLSKVNVQRRHLVVCRLVAVAIAHCVHTVDQTVLFVRLSIIIDGDCLCC